MKFKGKTVVITGTGVNLGQTSTINFFEGRGHSKIADINMQAAQFTLNLLNNVSTSIAEICHNDSTISTISADMTEQKAIVKSCGVSNKTSVVQLIRDIVMVEEVFNHV